MRLDCPPGRERVDDAAAAGTAHSLIIRLLAGLYKVDNFSVVDKERRDLQKLVEQIKSESGCVLVLGPRIAVRAGDPNRRPLDEILAAELLAGLGETTNESSSTLRYAADLHYRRNKDLLELQLCARDFYAREATATTEFHRHLAQLPFRLCINASPDSLMLNAFESVGKHPQKGCYSFQPKESSKKAALLTPTVDQPLVYSLFGHHEDMPSLVLTELNLVDYLVAIIRGAPAVPDEVRHMLKDKRASFLFLGFGFQNWHSRVLLKVLDVYSHNSRSFAFEDPQFVDSPESRHAIAFSATYSSNFATSAGSHSRSSSCKHTARACRLHRPNG